MSKLALITGGTRGIGLGIAIELAKEGFDLALNGLRDENHVKLVLVELSKYGVEVAYFRGDISKSAVRTQMVETIINRFGKINILINNAGIAPLERKDILDATEESFENVLTVNLQGPYFLTQLVAKKMINQKKLFPDEFFCIINISSVSATTASVNRGEYCISKAGISMASLVFSDRLSEDGILVFEVRPGLIQTDMTARVKDKYDKMIAEGVIPQKRWGMPEDIGKAVASLARGDWEFSTGSVFEISGGLNIRSL